MGVLIIVCSGISKLHALPLEKACTKVSTGCHRSSLDDKITTMTGVYLPFFYLHVQYLYKKDPFYIITCSGAIITSLVLAVQYWASY